MKYQLAATILATLTLMTQMKIASSEVRTPLQNQDFDGPWSVVTNIQGESCIADRHDHPINFNSTWCSDFIGMEAVKNWKEQVGNRPVQRSKRVPRTVYVNSVPTTVYDTVYYTEYEPIYQNFSKVYHIQEIQFDEGKYVYTGGEVSSALKAFLSSCPEGNIWVKLITQESETWNYEIGKDTVKEWKKIYSNQIIFN